MKTKAYWFWATVVLVALASPLAVASPLGISLDLPGIGSSIPANSASFSLSGNFNGSAASRSVTSAQMGALTIIRNVDGFSPALSQAAIKPTLFKSGDLEFFKASDPTTPYFDLHFSDALISGVHPITGGGAIQQESVSLVFEKVTAEYQRDPSDPFAAILPSASQVSDGSFVLDFALDLATDDSFFGDSSILMDATISGTAMAPTPEPASLILCAVGLVGLLVLCRRPSLHGSNC